MLRLSRQKLGDDRRVRYIEADVFTWEPDGVYDLVFFANWLSHVPPVSFESFWRTVRAALAPGGRVFFEDEATDAWRHETVEGDDVPVVRRSLEAGRTYRVVKVFWDLDELETKFRRCSPWAATVAHMNVERLEPTWPSPIGFGGITHPLGVPRGEDPGGHRVAL
ncbi:MAG: class I SAM-dependent methyltransferase [Actinobacteria bacterium]|nr:MAG: class I SAM-dependent methyltransferase [Actinomycetota bacterium]